MSLLLQESGSRLLCEDGNFLSAEDASAAPSFSLSPAATHTVGAQTITATWNAVNSPASDTLAITGGGAFASKSGYVKTGAFTATFTLTVSSLGGAVVIFDSLTSTSRLITAAALAPGAPTGVVGTNQGNGTTSVSFVAPADNGGAAITSYTVTGSDGLTVTGASSPILIGNNGSGTVTYTVQATNSTGTGAASAPSASVAISRTVAASFYVDNAGNYNNSGLSVAAAWNSIVRANAFTFIAGDSLIFTAGQSFNGNLVLNASGTAGSRICVGTGRISPSSPVTTYLPQENPATINCAAGTGVRIVNQQYWSIDNLHLAGTTGGSSPGAIGCGVDVKTTGGTKLLGNSITAVSITGIGDGIFVWTPSGQQGHDGLRIVGCHVYDCTRVGIIVTDFDRDTAAGGGSGGVLGQGTKTQNANIYIGYCHVHGLNYGEGITVRNTTTGLVEYCVVYDIALNLSGSTGLDTTIADGIVFQYCEVYNVIAPTSVDGVGCDFENSSNCVLQYSYIHDCDGAGYLSGIAKAGIGNQAGNVVRYNIFARNCRKNQAELYNFGNNVATAETCATDFYGNTVYATVANAWRPQAVDRGWNNILVSAPGAHCVFGAAGAPQSLIGNLYFASSGTTQVTANGVTHTSLASLRTAGYESNASVDYGVFGNPLLIDPAGATSGGTLPGAPVTTVLNFDVQVGSPAIGAGILLSLIGVADGGEDFHGFSTTTAPITAGADTSTALLGSGALAASAAAVSGAGAVATVIAGTGALIAGAAAVAGAGNVVTTGPSTGALVAQRAVVVGVGERSGTTPSTGLEIAIMDRVGALVGGRAYPNTFPQEPALPTWPAIRYTLISVDPIEDLCSHVEEEGTDTADVRVQFDLVAETYSGARELRHAMKRAMLGFDPPALPGSEFNTYDIETKVHRVVIDYLFYPSSD